MSVYRVLSIPDSKVPWYVLSTIPIKVAYENLPAGSQEAAWPWKDPSEGLANVSRFEVKRHYLGSLVVRIPTGGNDIGPEVCQGVL